jgi:hypothetical protein
MCLAVPPIHPPPPHPVRLLHPRLARYVSPREVAVKILKTRQVCRRGDDYLSCVVDWADVQFLTQGFSQLLAMPHLRDPDTFLRYYRDNFEALGIMPKHVKN